MSVQTGDTAPDFSLRDAQGDTFTLADYLGKQPIVVAFYPMAFTGG